LKKSPKKHGRRTRKTSKVNRSGNKASKKEQRPLVTTAKKRSGNRTQKARKGGSKRKEFSEKVRAGNAVSIRSKQGGKKGKVVQGSLRKIRGTVVVGKYKRGSDKVKLSFKGVKSIQKKIALFEQSEVVDKAIKDQLKRKKGRPPKGIIIIVRDKHGREAALIPPPSMVVNEANIRNKLNKFVASLGDGYSNTIQKIADQKKKRRKHKPRKGKNESQRKFKKRFHEWEVSEEEWEANQLGGGGGGDEGYEDYNPEDIQDVEMIFIYGK